jgi:hypothetical protein
MSQTPARISRKTQTDSEAKRQPTTVCVVGVAFLCGRIVVACSGSSAGFEARGSRLQLNTISNQNNIMSLSLAPDAKLRLPAVRPPARAPVIRPNPPRQPPKQGGGGGGRQGGGSGIGGQLLGKLIDAGAGALGNLGQGGGGGGGNPGPMPGPAPGDQGAAGPAGPTHQEQLELACINNGRTLQQCGLRP